MEGGGGGGCLSLQFSLLPFLPCEEGSGEFSPSPTTLNAQGLSWQRERRHGNTCSISQVLSRCKPICGERDGGETGRSGGGARENRQAVSTGKICYRRGNAMWQLSMATAGGSGAEICCFRCVCMRACTVNICACACAPIFPRHLAR